MKLNFNHLPVGNLPYEDINLCKQMMLRVFEDSPFLPELPLINPNDDILHKTVENFPYLKFKDNKLIIAEPTNEGMNQLVNLMEKIYNSSAPYDIDMFASQSPYFELYVAMLKRIHPTTTFINLIGPFTLANLIFNKNATIILTDKVYRKFVTYVVTIKALWFLKVIKHASPKTQPIIIFDERMLSRFGTLKRTNENINKDTVNVMLTKAFSKLRKEGALICVQSFEKCNWQLVFDTKCVDMISFDAYNNPTNLNIIAQDVNSFLAKGGCINWAIVPVMNETVIRSLNVNIIYDRFMSTLEELSKHGVSMDALLNQSTISIQGDLSKYSILFAEKSILLANSLADKFAPNKK